VTSESSVESLYYDYRCVTTFALHRVATYALEFEVLRGLNLLANKLMSGCGNYIICCIKKAPRLEASGGRAGRPFRGAESPELQWVQSSRTAALPRR
jgi:hypothetical protein